MKNNVKLIIGYYIVFISYWILEFQVFDRYFDERLSSIFSHAYLYFVASPVFVYVISKNNIKKSGKKSLKINTYISILILQSGLSVGVLKIFSIIEKVDNTDINVTIGFVDLFALLLIAPIFEELLYRRIILNSLEMEKMQAIICSALLFASVHLISQGFKQVCYTMILGVIWGYLATEGVGIKKLIFFHSFSNLWGYILPITLHKYSDFFEKLFNVISGMIIPILAFIILGCLVDKSQKSRKFIKIK